jgi:hypothetical protein
MPRFTNQPVPSLPQRLRSLRHRFWLGVSERVRWSRGAYREVPAGALPAQDEAVARRIEQLRGLYAVEFERRLGAATSLNNYEYLDILDRSWRLPLSLLEPARLLWSVHDNLQPGGVFVMVNHGPQEALAAEMFCTAAGLRRIAPGSAGGVLSRRRGLPPMLSCWQRWEDRPRAPRESIDIRI